jgi:8-oxo-dGTP pyrophosphatase MutT (NUDIX family)
MWASVQEDSQRDFCSLLQLRMVLGLKGCGFQPHRSLPSNEVKGTAGSRALSKPAPFRAFAKLLHHQTVFGRSAWSESKCALVIAHELVQPRAMGSARLELVGRSRKAAARKRAERQQVAAVCFRILSTGIEFLLVRTRRNRWTFPKGGVQVGLSHAQSAAIEAYEEAGVHGRIEEAAFAQYTIRKPRNSRSGEALHVIHAYLCEVLRLGEPEELNRNPTWFASAKVKRRLAEGRSAENMAELSRVVDRAVARIRRFPGRSLVGSDPLMRVKFEACEVHLQSRTTRASRISTLHADDQGRNLSVRQFDNTPRRGKILEIRLVQPVRS